MKKFITTIVTLLLTINAFALDVWDGTAVAWTNGSGTFSDPYLIETAENLAYLAQKVNEGYQAQGISVYKGKYFLMTDDLDLNNINWTPIGTANLDLNGYIFSGIFDGDYHTISNLSITSSLDGAALFMGLNESGSIRKLSVTNATINATGQGAAGIVGGITDDARVYRCSFSGNITVTHSATYCGGGGIAAIALSNASVAQCSFSGTYNTSNSGFIGNAGIGGIVGFAQDNVKIENCYNTGTLTVTANLMSVAAGIIGATNSSNDVTVSNCYNIGTLNAGTKGGIFGMVSPINPTKEEASITVTNCYYLNTCGGTTNYGISMTSDEMKTEDFKNQIDQSTHIFVMDNGINNGYPIHGLSDIKIYDADEITAHTARLSGNIRQGNDDIEIAILKYAVTNTTDWIEINVSTEGFVEANLVDLEPNTDYVYNLTIQFADGITKSCEQKYFTTLDNAGISETNKLEIQIYPNPTSDFIYIKNIEPQLVIIYSLDGKIIKTVENANVIDVRDLNKGMYLINIDGAITKLIKR